MTRDETIALFQKCEQARANALEDSKSRDEAHKAARVIWNAWAEEMLAERKALEEADYWDVEPRIEGQMTCNSRKTWDWITRARVDFSHCRVVETDAEAETVEPEESDVGTVAPFESIEVTEVGFDCSGFIFPERANFHSVQFHSITNFDDAQFHSLADFSNAKFHQLSGFDNTEFRAYARFIWAQFFARAYFLGAEFHATLDCDDAEFLNNALFHAAHFHADAYFNDAKFQGSAFFDNCIFRKRASFVAIRSQVGFDLSGAEFGRVPDFTQATLHRHPRLDNVTVAPGKWTGPVYHDNGQIDRDAPAKFRELKRFAIQGEDHRSELEFHAQEIRTSRFVTDSWGDFRFWIGWLYEVTSDFGRSVGRPFGIWCLVGLAAFCAYYFYSAAPSAWTCAGEVANGVMPWIESLYLSIKNGLIVIGPGSDSKLNQAHACLYGGTTATPVVPSSINMVQLLQNILSAPLIFLFLLGLRNQFKLK